MAIIDSLERIIGKENMRKVVSSSPYAFAVDALAMNVFSLSYALNEKLGAGMDWTETGKTRLAAAVGNILTGRPYGMYRDFIMNKFKITTESHWVKKYLVDVFVFATGQTPLYLLYLAAAGADSDEMKKGAAFLTLIAPVTGRPQGATYEYCRRQFGIVDQTSKNKDTIDKHATLR